ncbi:hypothetical protein PHYSODRAFT_329696 [Phytophthora sojae]|uniref:Uncharacterized protein n=1 Tax=Phytophthora sojae (strain P6497) TaxID=1094619 RepID=G4Z736_PHYSP|nr:hypothetical protein PHYSODRAFT_329696 [Phytophthora sojae]EGZ21788.1 hypothetical protein PHYSODRAFT_329696 [Phytophthora sojae]|eukprot:XP_009524505.1 hypothetical protein PHYSODRAFT_329696 [Phytophthora sojae]
MACVLAWTKSEIDILVQAWSEVEAKYPSLRCPRGSGTLNTKVYALFSKRSRFSRSALAVKHTQQHIRNFVLFVDRYDKDRQKDGERRWYQLSVDEREQRRGLVPRRARGLTTALGRSAFAKLLKMERVQRWLGGGSGEELQQQEQAEAASPTSSFHSPRSESPESEFGASLTHTCSPLSGDNTPGTEHDTERIEDHFQIPEPHNSDTSTCSLHSRSGDEDSPMSTASTASQGVPLKRVSTAEKPGKVKKVKTDMEVQGKLKHRDCNILLENLMQLHNTKMRRAVGKLRADIEGEIQRSSEMLLSILSNQFKDPSRSGDVAFVTKVLGMQKQQVRDRFDRFEMKRAKDEAECRALVGQRFV